MLFFFPLIKFAILKTFGVAFTGANDSNKRRRGERGSDERGSDSVGAMLVNDLTLSLSLDQIFTRCRLHRS